MATLIGSTLIAIRFAQLENFKSVVTDIKKRFPYYSFVSFSAIMIFIAHSRMLRELMGAIEKNMTMKSDFELIL